MIQRVQSLYLLAAAALLLASLFAPLAAYDGGYGMTGLQFSSPEGEAVTHPWGVVGFFLLGGLVALVAIFRFKDRRRQLRLVGYALLLAIVGCCAVVSYALAFGSEHGLSLRPAWGAILPLVAAVFAFMARRAIRRDEELVRAADRIR